ncbi:hypothetical protein [Caulobacter sp. CCG-8]|uniref:hypothetical protein n=1 Tax=Caulobacter sp. CCG-8 TaxID=3127958 RepID=UPI00307DA93D
MLTRFAPWACVATLVAGPAAAAPRACPASPELARLVAASSSIVEARFGLSQATLAKTVEHPAYIAAPLADATSLKGPMPGAVQIYPKDEAYLPPPDALRAAVDRRALLFLTQAGSPPQFYFAGYSPKALTPATAQAQAGVRSEIARQAAFLRAVPAPAAHDAEVRRLVSELGGLRGRPGADVRQRAIFARLEALGPAGVPAIVAHMDDRHVLAVPAISLTNHAADAFEGVRHYGPEQVVDALDAILNQITGQSFGAISNGGTEEQRGAAVSGWRVYVADLGCPAP